MTPAPLVLVSVGNTRTRYALARDGQLNPGVSIPNRDLAEDAGPLLEAGGPLAPVLIASVNEPVAARLERHLLARSGSPAVLRTGREVPIPVEHTLAQPATVGQDRLLTALGAFSASHQACVVIDAGTAVTVDFIDGQGVFHGGAIAPGLSMMLGALHAGAPALPNLGPRPELIPAPGREPFGKHTEQAMMIGAVAALRGLAHELIDRYAEFYQAYPRVVATGGDAALLFQDDALVEHVVPDLALMGMLTAWKLAGPDEQSDDAEP